MVSKGANQETSKGRGPRIGVDIAGSEPENELGKGGTFHTRTAGMSDGKRLGGHTLRLGKSAEQD